MKTRFTEEALLQTKKARPAWTNAATYEMKANHIFTCVSGVGSILKGIKDFDMSAIIEGVDKVAPVVAFYTRNRDWYSSIDFMQSSAFDNFTEFKNMFFDNDYKENNDDMKKHQGLEHYQYYLLNTLDKLVRNRKVPFRNRMEGISLFKYMFDNKNLDLNTTLFYRHTEDTNYLIR